VTFNWSAGSATAYILLVGSSQHRSDIYNSGIVHTLSITVNRIPTDGRTIFVTLTSQVNGSWITNNYTYTASNGVSTPTPTPVGTPSPTPTPAGLIINVTLDSSITTNPNAAAIAAMVNQAVAKYKALYSDPITVNILFRYATTDPDGSPLDPNNIAQSNFVIYTISWSTFINALSADATTSNDTTANASLPVTALSTSIIPSSAGGRAVGLNTAPAMFSNGSVGSGGPYDGIVTLNSNQPIQFTRPVSSGNYDGLRSTEHEIDEVLGLGSYLNVGGNNLRPQDLFSWSSPGHRNIGTSGLRYFSIDNGNTDIVGFSQDPSGDFGDWLSGSCPQATPYVQNAFACTGQSSDISATSPEGINLDVIGYDLASGPQATTIQSAGRSDKSAALIPVPAVFAAGKHASHGELGH
jgi:hypothetical protein